MWQDGFATSRAIKSNINSQQDIQVAFEELTYVKGAAIIRMFESMLGENSFKNGLIVNFII